MRRMNSILDGHQGASGRTSSWYLRMASWTEGSFQDKGRWTMRLGNSTCSAGGRLDSTVISSASSLRRLRRVLS